MKKRNKHNKYLLLLASLALVVTAVIGTTLAYLVSSPPAVTNTFTPGKITSKVDEELVKWKKSNVKIQNTGNGDAYIRAKVVITWRDAEGNVLAEQPVGGEEKDYTVDYNLTATAESKWFESDGFYYWNSKVPAGQSTGVLIDKLEQKNFPDGHELHVEILAEAIQAEPEQAVIDAWGFVPGKSNS